MRGTVAVSSTWLGAARRLRPRTALDPNWSPLAVPVRKVFTLVEVTLKSPHNDPSTPPRRPSSTPPRFTASPVDDEARAQM